jgi:hypothetical protein
MFLVFLFIVILIAVAGVFTFSLYDKKVGQKDDDETKWDDFEIIDVDTPTKSASERGM